MELKDLEIYRNMSELEKTEVIVLASIRIGIPHKTDDCSFCEFLVFDKRTEMYLCNLFRKKMNLPIRFPECKLFLPDDLYE